MLLVTGATGFLGKNLVPYLAARDYPLRVLVRHPETPPWLNSHAAEVVQGDVRDAEAMRQAVRGCRYVVHAGGVFRMWGDAAEFEHTNVQGTTNVMHAADAAGVERFVHISTIAVIGNPIPGRIIDETHPPRPADPYQRSKLAGEQVALSLFHERDLPVIILRPGAFYGPHGRYAFNRLFFEDPLKGLLIKVNHGRHVIFPVFIGDVAAAIDRALQRGRLGEIYNISGDPISHNEANDIVSEEAHITGFRLNAPGWMMIALARAWTWLSHYTHVEPYYPINLRSYVFNDWQVSSQKARDELGCCTTPFREGARQTLDWYRTLDLWWARRLRR